MYYFWAICTIDCAGLSLTVSAGYAARMGWTRGEARVAEDSDFETLKQLLASKDGWNLEYEKDGVKVWAEDAAHGALRTVKVLFCIRFLIYQL